MTPPRPLQMTHKIVPIDEVTAFPGNARLGDQAGIGESLDAHGQFDPLIVQASTGHIIAGNNTWAAMKQQGATEVAISLVDVDDDTARKMNLVHNRLNDKARYDDRLLLEMLADLDDLDGTGYDADDIDALEESLRTADLDELADEIGDPGRDDGWPSINVRVPHVVMAAWKSHVDTHSGDDAQAMAGLLGIDWDQVDSADR
jgi:ParB-like chromosome segregation protein Spo0J